MFVCVWRGGFKVGTLGHYNSGPNVVFETLGTIYIYIYIYTYHPSVCPSVHLVVRPIVVRPIVVVFRPLSVRPVVSRRVRPVSRRCRPLSVRPVVLPSSSSVLCPSVHVRPSVAVRPLSVRPRTSVVVVVRPLSVRPSTSVLCLSATNGPPPPYIGKYDLLRFFNSYATRP